MSDVPADHLKLSRLIPLAAQLAATLKLGHRALPQIERDVRNSIKHTARSLAGSDVDLETSFSVFNTKIDVAVMGVRLSDEFRDAVYALQKHLLIRSCKNCSATKRLPDMKCQVNTSTSRSVQLGGNCITEIFELYRSVAEEIATLWRTMDTGFEPPALHLSTSDFSVADKRAVHTDYAIRARAKSIKSARPTTAVIIDFADGQFDWPEYLLLPYLIFHEIVCHGYQDLYALDGLTPKIRPGADASCRWSEGWMDAVAHNLAKAWLGRMAQDGHTSFAGEQLTQANAHTLSFHEGRYAVEEAICEPERALGRDAYHDMVNSLGRPKLAGSQEAARAAVVRFSLLLNALVLPEDMAGHDRNLRRWKIAKELHLALKRDKAQMVWDTVRQFLDTRDVTLLPRPAPGL